ncbi:hypothetical protein D1007_36708 [Hordeum vulgare]|nr:hypothetical protein D1007_36708 [Hordeum vulgare]
MEKSLNELLLNQKSLERIVETKFHDLDNKVTEFTTTVNQLKQEVDAVPLPKSHDGAERPTLTIKILFRTKARSADVHAQYVICSMSAPAPTSTVPPSTAPVSTPPA